MALFTIFLFIFETKLEILKYLSILYQKYYLNTNFSMKITNVLFDKSISIDSDKVYFDNKKQIVFVWRSNVGKSSLMNSIFEKKDLVKTSSLPGKTKTANLFTVNNKFHFVDLPGYWFAKLWKENQKKLFHMFSPVWNVETKENTAFDCIKKSYKITSWIKIFKFILIFLILWIIFLPFDYLSSVVEWYSKVIQFFYAIITFILFWWLYEMVITSIYKNIMLWENIASNNDEKIEEEELELF